MLKADRENADHKAVSKILHLSGRSLYPQVSAVECTDALLTRIQGAEQGPCLSTTWLLHSCQEFGIIIEEMENLGPSYTMPLHVLTILSSNYNISSETTQYEGTKLSFPLSTLPVSS